MHHLIFLFMAYCAFVPMIINIVNLFKNMCCNILPISADCALIPVTILIVLLLIVVSYASHITTKIASRVA